MRVIFITGASSGIGAELAKQYAKPGVHLILFARRESELEAVGAACRENGAKVFLAIGDVTKRADLNAAVDKAHSLWGKPVDTVVANAGFGVGGGFEAMSTEDYRRQFDVNLFGVIDTIYAVFDDLKETRGRIAILGSVLSYISLPKASAYCMSKFAVKALADSMYLDLGPKGISVTLICPGMVDSDIRRRDKNGNYVAHQKDMSPEWIRMPTDVAAKQIHRAIEGRKREVVITVHGKLGVLLQRYAPWVVRFFVRRRQSSGIAASQAAAVGKS